jgi:hypothetical protein
MDRDERKILGRCASSIKNCKLLVKGDAGELERLSLRPPRIAWVSQWQGRSSQGPEAVDANSVSENCYILGVRGSARVSTSRELP